MDLKVGEPATSRASRARRERIAYRERVLEALTGAGFELVEKPVVGNESRVFSADLAETRLAEETQYRGITRILRALIMVS